ncbi:hypothetical protein SUGI_0881470 [Cryptomeria japonica]|nr:hypothetical protein SUGI_0881470 [Cryptomeria japonica]
MPKLSLPRFITTCRFMGFRQLHLEEFTCFLDGIAIFKYGCDTFGSAADLNFTRNHGLKRKNILRIKSNIT